VTHDEQETAGRHGARSRSQHPVAGELDGRVQVLSADQVEGAAGDGDREVVPLPVDAVCDTAGRSLRGGPAEDGGRDADGGDGPAASGEPEGVGPLRRSRGRVRYAVGDGR